MNVHSLSNPAFRSHYSLGNGWRSVGLKILAATRNKDGPLNRKLRRSAQPRRPLFLHVSRQGVQDFVSHAGFKECETTGTDCAAGSNPANGSGVGCPMNWKIAAAILKINVANTAVSIAPRPFSSEPARIPYIVRSFFIILRRRGLPALSVGC